MIKTKKRITPDMFYIIPGDCMVTYGNVLRFVLVMKDGYDFEEYFTDAPTQLFMSTRADDVFMFFYSTTDGLFGKDNNRNAVCLVNNADWCILTPEEISDFNTAMSLLSADIILQQYAQKDSKLNLSHYFFPCNTNWIEI